MKIVKTLFLLMLLQSAMAQPILTSEGVSLVRIAGHEKQNKPVKAMVSVLLEAWCNGDIQAYYPNQPEKEVSYAQFLYHFGMQEKAYHLLSRQAPSWFCSEEKAHCPLIEPYELTCLQEEVELAETNRFNAITSRQEKQIHYVKLIYSANCTATGIEVEAPVFYMNDIKQLPSTYRVPNPQNDAAALPVWSYLTLGNYSRSTIKMKNQFVEDPAAKTALQLSDRVSNESVVYD